MKNPNPRKNPVLGGAKPSPWTLLTRSCFEAICRSELLLSRARNPRSVVKASVSVLTITNLFAFLALLATVVALVALLTGCANSRPLKGGQANSQIVRPGYTNWATLTQPENPNQPSRQAVQSRQTLDYVLPAGTKISLGGGPAGQSPTSPKPASFPERQAKQRPGQQDLALDPVPSADSSVALLAQSMPVRFTATDRTETTVGAAQKDTAREWAAKAASLQPVTWAGIAMMTLVAGTLAYFGWWTKAGLALAVGVGMVVLAQALPGHGALILLSGLGLFALAALLVLYAYSKGQLDQNHNGIPDFLERPTKTTP